MSRTLTLSAFLLSVMLLPSFAFAAIIEDTDNANIFTEGGGNWAGLDVNFGGTGMIYKPQVTQTTVDNICFYVGADTAADSGVYNISVYNRGNGNFPTGGSNTLLGTSADLSISPPDVDIAQHFSNDIGTWEVNCFSFAAPIAWNANDGIVIRANKVSGDSLYFIQGGGSGNPSNDPDFPAVATGSYTNTATWYGQAVPVIFADSPIAPPAPTTEFNEVLDYIYDPVRDNSFGTSTIGASFSIAQPDWVSSVGVRLRDPNGSIVWNATTSTAVAGLYDIDTAYYFGVSGAYELEAYFISDTGALIENPVTLYITVNVEEWVFDPVTGDLVPVSSTTISTSTLDNFKIECPDNWLIGGLCKLAVGFLVPKATSIQGVQASFGTLMSKAPFSFFTQSKTVLDAFRVGTASSGGAFSLSLYGESIPIVSSTTASNVGLTSGTIDIFKSIMVVGLWLMLAWYLYWRIASIFGV